MSTTAEDARKSDVKGVILAFEGFKWWQSFLVGLILFLFFSLFTSNWLLLFLLGIIVGFLSGRKMLVASGITASSLILAWLLLFLFNMIFTNFRTLEAADALLAIATGSSGLGPVFLVIALVLAALLGLTSGAFGAAVFQEWEIVKTRMLKE